MKNDKTMVNDELSMMNEKENSQFTTHNSTLKKGYKQTEVGVIPEDWTVNQLNELATFGSGTTPSRDAFIKYFKNGTTCWVKTLDLNNSTINDTEEKVTDTALREVGSLKVFLPKTVLIAMYGGFNQIGRTGILNIPACTNQALTSIRANKVKLDSLFLLHLLNYKVNYWKEVASSSRKDPNITSADVKVFPIPLPPTLTEQTAIATALSDMDSLIEGLEKLIAKKQNIKQGAMQELLTPYVMVNGELLMVNGKPKMKEGWVVKTVAQIGKPYGGLSGKAKNDFEKGTMPYIPFMNIMSNPIIDITYFDYVNIKKGENQNEAQKGDLFFNTSSETPEEVGMCSVLLDDIPNLYLNSFCFGFRFHNETEDDGLYLSYFFRSSYGRKKMSLLAQGATRYNLSKSNFLKLELELPKPEEQTRIAQILSDMDTEITELETQLEKYKKIKTGMMQELLTGKKRLV